MAKELSQQLDQMRYLGELTRSAVSENQQNLTHVSREVERGFQHISAVLQQAPSGSKAQQRELLDQVDLVLSHNRQLLEEAHQTNLSQLRQAAAQPPQTQSSALDEFLEGATFGLFKR